MISCVKEYYLITFDDDILIFCKNYPNAISGDAHPEPLLLVRNNYNPIMNK